MQTKRFLSLALTALFVAGCATTSLTKDDLASARKYYVGTLVDKQIMEMDRTEKGMFGSKVVKATYLRLAVTNDEGQTRYFYNLTENESDARTLQTYFYSLIKGDKVQLDLGFIDAGQNEEEFEGVLKL
ncbi:hypothetical protein J6T93_05975 [bacterium]|nr:hypothetical protein [bacterium]